MKKIIGYIFELIRFVTIDIWRITEHDETGRRGIVYYILKTIVLTVQRFFKGRLAVKASALTYYSVFAMIPLLAFIFGIARGFGMDSHIADFLIKEIGTQGDSLKVVFGMIESYLEHTKGGAFIGIGIVFLLWSVMKVFTQIENSFNEIWQVKKPRSVVRKFTDYFSLLFLVPFLIAISSAISFYFKYLGAAFNDNFIISPTVSTMLSFQPYLITWLIFTMLYLIIPNTKVKFKNAFCAGVLAGTAFQIFKQIYVYGQTWATNYNAVYGSLAAIPLLLLFIQITWIIVLFGAELSFAGQSVRNYEFESDVKLISQRYYEFVAVAIAKIVIKRFEKGEQPLSLNQISSQYKMPISLVSVIVDDLCKVGILNETFGSTYGDIAYQPAIDVNVISVAFLLERVNHYGSENFKIEEREEFAHIWEYLNRSHELERKENSEILIKDM